MVNGQDCLRHKLRVFKKVWVDEVRRTVHVTDMSVCIMLMVCACYPTVLNCVQWNMPPALKNFLSIHLFLSFFVPCHRKQLVRRTDVQLTMGLERRWLYFLWHGMNPCSVRSHG